MRSDGRDVELVGHDLPAELEVERHGRAAGIAPQSRTPASAQTAGSRKRSSAAPMLDGRARRAFAMPPAGSGFSLPRRAIAGRSRRASGRFGETRRMARLVGMLVAVDRAASSGRPGRSSGVA